MFIEIKDTKMRFETDYFADYFNNGKMVDVSNPLFFEAYNVEFGSCASISNKNSFTLMDAGTKVSITDPKIQNTLNFVVNKINNYKHFDFVLTHFHKDHYSLISDILNSSRSYLRYLFIYNPFHKKIIFELSLINLLMCVIDKRENVRDEAKYLILRFFADNYFKKLVNQKKIQKVYFVKEKCKFYLNERVFYTLDNISDDLNLFKNHQFKGDDIFNDFYSFLNKYFAIPLVEKIKELRDEYEYINIYYKDDKIKTDSDLIETISEDTFEEKDKMDFFFNDKIDEIIDLFDSSKDNSFLNEKIINSEFYKKYIKELRKIRRFINEHELNLTFVDVYDHILVGGDCSYKNLKYGLIKRYGYNNIDFILINAPHHGTKGYFPFELGNITSNYVVGSNGRGFKRYGKFSLNEYSRISNTFLLTNSRFENEPITNFNIKNLHNIKIYTYDNEPVTDAIMF